MSNKRIMGIDPGITGALCLINGDCKDLIEVVDMPTVEVKRGSSTKNEVSPAVLSNIILRWKPEIAIIERVNAMPGQGVTSMFNFGKSAGILEGVIASRHVPMHFMTAQEWKRKHGIPTGAPKDESRARTLALIPQHADHFARKKDHGRADAFLIAAAYAGWTC